MATEKVSSSSSSSECSRYDVFLSFRGEDTRYDFTGHLYKALMNAGFLTFLDDDGIERGEDIKSELQKAIEESRISIIVLSENFPSSRWCLDELVMILQRRRTCKLAVLPVFFDVDPSHFRKQTESVAEVFLRHKERFKLEGNDKGEERIKEWKAALTEVANLAGMPFNSQADGYQWKFVEEIIKVVQDKLKIWPLSIDSQLIGIDYRTENINMWLKNKSSDVGILVIHGIGENKLVMHQLIQDMGKQIVRTNSKKYPEKCSRLWNHSDSLDVLRSKIGTEYIEGLILKWKSSNTEVLETDTFKRMCNLRILKLNYAHLNGCYNVFPKKIKWLCWHGFPLNFIPNDFPLEGLVALDMRHSNLKHLWKGAKLLESLKMLNLSHSTLLTRTPNFSVMPNLEKLLLKNCPDLVEIHASLSNLKKLIILNLRDCKRLRKLPRNIGTVKSLEQLIIAGCSNLVGAMEEVKMMSSLQLFVPDGISVDKLLSPSEEIGPWLTFITPWLSRQRKTREVSWTSLPSSLVRMSLVGCNLSDSDFPVEFSNLTMLKFLNLGSNPFHNLPDCVKGLPNLKELSLRSCSELRLLEWSSFQQTYLNVINCHSLEKIAFQASPGYFHILYDGCEMLRQVQDVHAWKYVNEMDVEALNTIGFFNLDSMPNSKVAYDNGVFSTAFSGRKVPDWFSYKSMSSVISLVVPSHPNVRIRGFNLCLVYTISPHDDFDKVWIVGQVINKSKNLVARNVFCDNDFPNYGIVEPNEPMVWLSYWLCDGLFEDDDHMEVSFDMVTGNGEIKECGIHFLFEEEEEKQKKNLKCQHLAGFGDKFNRAFSGEFRLTNNGRLWWRNDDDAEHMFNSLVPMGFFDGDFRLMMNWSRWRSFDDVEEEKPEEVAQPLKKRKLNESCSHC